MCFSPLYSLIRCWSLIDFPIAKLNPSVQISVLHYSAELRDVSTFGIFRAPFLLVRNRCVGATVWWVLDVEDGLASLNEGQEAGTLLHL